MKTHLTPLVGMTLALALGILLAGTFGFYAMAFLAALPVLLFMYMRKRTLSSTGVGAFEIMLFCSLCGIGATMGWSARQLPANHVSNLIGQTLRLEGTVADGSTVTAKGQKALLESKGDFAGKVLLYFPAKAPSIAHHSQVQLEAKIEGLPENNPGYARYLRSQGVLATARVQAIEVVGREEGMGYHLGELRQGISARLKANMLDPRMAGLANAMFVGDRSQLDSELRADFAATGLSHILSISGMHVTLFYLFLNFILGIMGRRLMTRHLRTGLILAALVGYMALTGFSPAVCRSVFMLSALRLSESFFLEKNSLNILALSAFVLLLIDPLLVQDLGFQLSYLAVAGLILVAPRIERLFATRIGFVPACIRQALAMSLAAQLTTTPLVLIHFGQFPAYFLLANLILLPVVTVATNMGIASMLFCWVPGLGEFLGQSLDGLLWVVSEGSTFIASLPGAVVTKCSFADMGFCVLLSTLLPLIIAVLIPEIKLAANWIHAAFQGQFNLNFQTTTFSTVVLMVIMGGVMVWA